MILLQILLCIFAPKSILMKNLIVVIFILSFSVGNAQKGKELSKQLRTDNSSLSTKAKDTTQFKKIKTATFDQYRIITLQKDTTYVDTSLTIKKEYEYNYLRKDIFGLFLQLNLEIVINDKANRDTIVFILIIYYKNTI